MSWLKIPQLHWEYSTTPAIDDPENSTKYADAVNGIITDHNGTQVYAFCRQMLRTHGIGYGDICKRVPVAYRIENNINFKEKVS